MNVAAWPPGIAWWLALAGWSAVIALWHTTAIALALAMWRLIGRRVSARTEYTAAASALALAATLTLITPLALRWQPTPMAPTPVAAPAVTRSAPATSPLAVAPAGWPAAAASMATPVVRWIGVLWCLGFVIALVRFGGGWALAQWIRWTATEVRSPRIAEAAAGVSAAWGLPAAPMLVSAHVEGPVVIGARSPAVLLPADLEERLSEEALPPLLAHELAHVRRHDYAANLVQSLADAVLWFSPGARWISRHVREAREYCCDELVAERCGAAVYATALTTLAGLGVAARARPAVSAAGPRLICRIRRLLQEDPMTPFPRTRTASTTAALLFAVLAGLVIVPVAAKQARVGAAVSRHSTGSVPRGFATQQPGSPLLVRSFEGSDGALCGTAVVHNQANRAITRLQFVAALETFGVRPSAALEPSAPIDVSIPPSGDAAVTVNLMPAIGARSGLAASDGVQVMCALGQVWFDNGALWSASLNPTATTARDALGLQKPELSRVLVGVRAKRSDGICEDDRAGTYSQGAIVPIRLEPGSFARCEAGAWSEYALPGATPGEAFVLMHVRFENGHSASVGVEPGEMARLGRWGLQPIVDRADDQQVRLQVYDLDVSPMSRIAELSLRAGGEAADVPAASFDVRVASTRTP